jgi:hypothetical protein
MFESMVTNVAELPALPKCKRGHDIPGNVTLCIVCSLPVGFPNVRYAERSEEVRALDRRVRDARISSTARGTLETLEAFGAAVDGSNAVINRSRADLEYLLGGDGKLMQAFHPAVRAGLRVPENNQFDPDRDANDSRISPLFYDKIHFAALTLDRSGVPHYGDFAITLRQDFIAERSSVFWENPVKFNEEHPAGRGKPVPYGYRATWGVRSKLAMAKLHPKIDTSTVEAEFPDILLEKTPDPTGYSDFIEVHIYGDIHPRAFEHVRADVIDDDIEKLLWQRMQFRLKHFEVTFDEVEQ